MTITGRRLTLYQGQDETIRFAVSGAAGATAAAFYVAVSSGAPADLHDLDLTTSGGDVTLTDAGADLQVDVRLTGAQTEALPLGFRVFELWVTKGGQTKPASIGVLMVTPSLRN